MGERGGKSSGVEDEVRVEIAWWLVCMLVTRGVRAWREPQLVGGVRVAGGRL